MGERAEGTIGSTLPMHHQSFDKAVRVVVQMPTAITKGHYLSESMDQLFLRAPRPISSQLPKQASTGLVRTVTSRGDQVVPQICLRLTGQTGKDSGRKSDLPFRENRDVRETWFDGKDVAQEGLPKPG